MMQQVDTKLDVYSTQNLLRAFKVVYLRQYAHCEGMENMTAERFLRCNAALYNASEECLLRLVHFIYKFKSTKIGSLSGGQIRLVIPLHNTTWKRYNDWPLLLILFCCYCRLRAGG